MKISDAKGITESQAKVFIILQNQRMKVRVTICVLVGFFIILGLLITLTTIIPTPLGDKVVVGFMGSVLAYTMYPLVRHYLPSAQSASDIEKQLKKYLPAK